MVRKTKRPLEEKTNGDFWALTTVIAFPVAMLAAGSFGFGPVGSFVWGMAASCAALLANTITESRVWMFEQKWAERFDRPDFAFRLAIVTGSVLLLLESAVLVMLFTGSAERNMIGIVFERHCQPAQPEYIEFCAMLDRTLSQSAR
ncbi:MAG: hypothetical protein WCK01_03105 [Candidatus Uhrbacteria bacterium]